MKKRWLSAVAGAGMWTGIAFGQTGVPDTTPPPPETVNPVTNRPAYTNSTPDPDDTLYKYDTNTNKTKGLTLLVGGGVEGYTGSLAPQISPGPNWDVTVAIRPLTVLGVEATYTGARNDVRNRSAFPGGSGPDIVRNGVNGVITLGTPTDIQPYILGGVGIHHYSVRSGLAAAGFHSDTSGRIPLGAGLRTHFGYFTADLRFVYNVLFNQGFATTVASRNIAGVNSIDGGSYGGMLQIGSTFF